MRETKKEFAWLMLCIMLFNLLSAIPAAAQSSGGSYQIQQSTIAGGGGQSTGSTLSLTATIGQSIIGASSSGGTFNLSGGFWSAAAGATCPPSGISPTSQNISASGGAGSVNITAGTGCAWTAVSNDAFITITSLQTGVGNSTVNYTVAANTSVTQRTGTLTIAGQTFTVTQDGAAVSTSTMQFSQSSYSITENFNPATGINSILIPVARTGDTSQAATINYSTSDAAGLSNCNPNEGAIPGVASSRCDYAVAFGTLRFAPGETMKTFTLIVMDDAYVEGPESLTLTLSNSVGASLGTQSTATVTITDNDLIGTVPNPIDSTPFFVRQHYVDFLNREPDPGGYQGWQDILNPCASSDTRCDRIEVSSGFFRSPEFQERGYFVYRFYSVSLGRKPNYSEFMPDLAKVSGFLTDAEKEANKVAFVQEFMARTEFKTRYASTLNNPTAYVDALLQTSGLQTHPSRAGWIAGLQIGSLTRDRVLKELAESGEAYSKFYTEAFVVMQYFGYLRRDPDILYLEWIKTMNQNGGDYRGMINGFMNSAEYHKRFGQ